MRDLDAVTASMPLPVSRVAAHPRYNAVAQALHWLTAALVAAVLPLAWVAESLARDAPNKGTFFTLHKTVGLTILGLIVLRLLWRATHPAPPDPGTPRGIFAFARLNHWLLYTIFLVMPVSGYLLSALGGRDTSYFWLFTIPGLPKDEAWQGTFDKVHLFGQWAVYALVLLHICGALWHVVVRRDGVHERMLPVQHPV
jgi:cytochrome b561